MILDLNETVFKANGRFFKCKKLEQKNFQFLQTFFPGMHCQFWFPVFQETNEAGEPLQKVPVWESEIKPDDLKVSNDEPEQTWNCFLRKRRSCHDSLCWRSRELHTVPSHKARNGIASDHVPVHGSFLFSTERRSLMERRNYYVPATKAGLVDWLSKYYGKPFTYFKAKSKKQLYAIYFETRERAADSGQVNYDRHSSEDWGSEKRCWHLNPVQAYYRLSTESGRRKCKTIKTKIYQRILWAKKNLDRLGGKFSFPKISRPLAELPLLERMRPFPPSPCPRISRMTVKRRKRNAKRAARPSRKTKVGIG